MAANKNVCLRWPRGARDSINAALLCSARYTTAAVLGICSMSCFCLCLCLYPYASFVCLAQAVDSLTSSPSFLSR